MENIQSNFMETLISNESSLPLHYLIFSSVLVTHTDLLSSYALEELFHKVAGIKLYRWGSRNYDSFF